MKYDRTKGSKKDQGIKTPKKNKRYGCGCTFKHNVSDNSYSLLAQCQKHEDLNAPQAYLKFLEFIRPKNMKTRLDNFLKSFKKNKK